MSLFRKNMTGRVFKVLPRVHNSICPFQKICVGYIRYRSAEVTSESPWNEQEQRTTFYVWFALKSTWVPITWQHTLTQTVRTVSNRFPLVSPSQRGKITWTGNCVHWNRSREYLLTLNSTPLDWRHQSDLARVGIGSFLLDYQREYSRYLQKISRTSLELV